MLVWSSRMNCSSRYWKNCKSNHSALGLYVVWGFIRVRQGIEASFSEFIYQKYLKMQVAI